ncbi:S-layer homology domain-containing protein, partial [Patescibacteria group bacterium]|nr:S-layer homology domain-containing protein [Patescibacteria group bacterium]
MVQTLKRTIASICLAALVASFALVAPAHAGTFADVSADHWAYAAVEKLATDGVLVKRTNFYPGDPVNRAQVVKLAVEATNLEKVTPSSDPFPDVPKDSWYGTYVATAVQNGIVAGYPDGKFRPDQTINRAEAAKIVHTAFGFAENTANGPHFTDVKINDWFYKYVETLYNNTVVKGKGAGTYAPEATLNRAEMAIMIYRAQNPTP